MRILFIGGGGQNGKLRVRSLQRMGHRVAVLAYDALGGMPEATLLKAMRLPIEGLVDRWVEHRLSRAPELAEGYDLVFVNQPRILGPRCYRLLRSRSRAIVNYVNDDPFGHRHLPDWKLFLRTLPLNDLVAVSRDLNLEEARQLGARRVLRIPFPADEELHRPIELAPEERERWSSEVVFVGTWYPDRGPFMRELIERGVPLHIHGGGWSRAPEWPALRDCVRGGPLRGEDYVKAIGGAKIALGLLSRENRDQCTRRSMEIPAIGTLLCAERSDEHRRLYEEGREAVFFGDARECAEACRALLADDARRRAIAAAGHQRFLASGATNRGMLEQILAAVEEDLRREPDAAPGAAAARQG